MRAGWTSIRKRADFLLVALALAAAPRGASAQEGRLGLEIPEVIVVGRGVPVIRTERPVRPLPGRLSAAGLDLSPSPQDIFPPARPLAFEPPGLTPALERPDKCYESPSSARRLIEEEGAPAHFRVGYLSFLANRWPEAERQFRLGLGKRPDPITASFLGYWLGEALFRRGERAEAREVWGRVAADPAGPFAGAAAYRLGLLAYAREDYREARARMETVADRFPAHPGAAAAAFLAGESSWKLGDRAGALWRYAAAAGGPGGRELRRLARFREGKTLLALERYREASGSLEGFLRFPDVEADLRREARLALGWSLYHGRRLADAQRVFSGSLSGGGVPSGSGAWGEAHVGWLLSSLALGREEESRRAWAGLKEARPAGRFTLWGALALGGWLSESGRFQEAANLLGEILREVDRAESGGGGPLAVRARLLRGVSLYNLGGRFQEAASVFRTVSDADGNVDAGLRLRGTHGLVLALLKAGDPAGAAAAAESERFPASPLLPEIRFWRGEALLRLKRFAEARSEFEKIPAGHGRGPEAALGRAYSLYEEGLWGDASAAFRAAAALRSARPDLRAEATLRQAEARFNARDYEGAGETYRKVLADFPKSRVAETAALRFGQMLFQRADYPGAGAAFAAFLSRWPKSGRRDEALYWQGLSQIRGGRFALARVALERLVRDFPKSGFRTAAILQIGNAYYNEGRFEESAAAYRRVLDASPSPRQAREARYGLVLTRLRSGGTEEFIRDARAFLQKEPDPELATALEFQVAEIYLAQKRFQEATAAYVRVLRRGGKEADVAHFRIGEIKRMEGKPAEAAEYFRDVIEKYPRSPVRADARFRLAESLAARGDCSGALREYRRFLEQHPDHSLLAQARYAAGTCALRLKDAAAAEGFFSLVVRGGGSGVLMAASHYELGRIAREKGRAEEALGHLEAALKGGVDARLRPRIQFDLGSLRESLRQYPQAVVEYLKVVYLHPQAQDLGSRALLRVAGIYELQGEKARALDLYRKVARDAPDPSVRAGARERIRSLAGASREGSR